MKRSVSTLILSSLVAALALGCSVRPQNCRAGSDGKGTRISIGTSPSSLALADFNRDGKLDLAVPNSGSHNVAILLGDGAGGFRPAAGSPFAAGHSPSGIAVGDVNNDGNLDLAFANHDTNYSEIKFSVCLQTRGPVSRVNNTAAVTFIDKGARREYNHNRQQRA